MASLKRIEANRKNAQKSTGPRTEAGKERSRINAITHGLSTTVIDVLPHENAEAFADEVRAWTRDLAPRNRQELRLARQAATISWKLDRAERFETTILSRAVIDAVSACDCADDDIAALNEAAAIASFDSGADGERIRRYQFALMRELRHTLDAFAKLKKQPNARNEPNQSNEAISVVSSVDRAMHAFHADPESDNTNEPISSARISEPAFATPDDSSTNEPISDEETPNVGDVQDQLVTENAIPRDRHGRRPSSQWLLERRRASLAAQTPRGKRRRDRKANPCDQMTT